MAVDRETIFVALFARFSAITDFKYKSRIFQDWLETPPPLQPAFFMVKTHEHVVPRMRLPPQWSLGANVVLYCRNVQDRTVPASTQVNKLLADVEQALQLQPGELPASPAPRVSYASAVSGYTWNTTLGGLCHQAAIEGTVEVYEGVIGGAAMCIVPIVVRVDGW